jgi:hypothetical protein
MRSGNSYRIRLAKELPSLAVAKNGPGDAGVLELLDGDLAGEGTVGLIVDILRGDFNIVVEILADEEKEEGRRRHDDLCSV